MDKTTALGIILGIGAVLLGAVLDQTRLESLLSLPAFFIVIGGTLGATIASNPTADVMRLPVLLRTALVEKATPANELVDLFVDLATRARKDGVLSLEADAARLPDAFLRKGLQLVVDGADEEIIRQVLEADIAATRERHRTGYTMFDTMGGFAPTLGILGAVLGLIHVLSQVDDPTKLAAGIAVAFVATLYGVGSANLIFFPLANKLRSRSEAEEQLRHLMLQGILAIQAGDNPRIVRDKLEVYLAPGKRSDSTAAASSAPRSMPATRTEAA
ncbi:MAG: flagellar motor protein [Chloroflexi bacterium]|nr:flagellar motor protein [Chloroflexota bacterium]